METFATQIIEQSMIFLCLSMIGIDANLGISIQLYSVGTNLIWPQFIRHIGINQPHALKLPTGLGPLVVDTAANAYVALAAHLVARLLDLWNFLQFAAQVASSTDLTHALASE